MRTGIDLIAQERIEQIEKHKRTIADDIIENDNGQLAIAAIMLLSVDFEEGIDPASYPDGWSGNWCLNACNKPYKERLIIAGALIAAELDRINSVKI